MLLQVAHDAIGRRETVGRTAREHDSVQRVVGRGRVGQVRLARRRAAAAHVDAGTRAVIEHEHGHTRPRRIVLGIADTQPLDIGDLDLFGQLRVHKNHPVI